MAPIQPLSIKSHTLSPGQRYAGRIVLAVALLTLVAGCARGDAADQGQPQGGFYGGIGGGFTR